ncbi:MAG TPA: FAD-binding protein [Candidatus Saccharimonadales bacterium]|jgi:UDP-N-acetylmuramate dehydrogenase
MTTTDPPLLAPYTSLHVGGPAAKLAMPTSRQAVLELLDSTNDETQLQLFGYGCNSLISDDGLPGTTIIWRGGDIRQDGDVVVTDAGVWWDELVRYCIDQGLWGLELTSEIPGSVGAGVFGNIAAYGQQISDTLLWIEVFDRTSHQTRRLTKQDISFSYRESSLQVSPELCILQAAFSLSRQPLHAVRYDTILTVAEELSVDLATLDGRRQATIETRRRAGSLWHFDDPTAQRTAGSFFKNPLVTPEQAVHLAAYDESGKTLERINRQNKVHGGSSHRASAAHVLLASGFARGQTWGNVRLHPDHVLKIETLPGATAQDVYAVSQEIIATVQAKLNITITPEVRFFGTF